MATIESERKFLVNGTAFLDMLEAGAFPAHAKKEIEQGYLSTHIPTIRVRSVMEVHGDKVQRWFYVTAKGPGLQHRVEVEFEVTDKVALDLLNMSQYVIQKTRYDVIFEKNLWQVDVFHSVPGLIMAELEGAADTAKIPPWATKEVTMDRRYANSNLAQFGAPLSRRKPKPPQKKKTKNTKR